MPYLPHAMTPANPHEQVRDLHGELAWPTLALFFAGTSLFAATVAGHTAGAVPTWLAFAVNTLALYLLFTPAHEAVHGNIRGRSGLPGAVEAAVGWVSAGAFLFPYPVFSYVHRTHHKHTNHPERDPDYWVANKGPLGVLGACLSMLPDYYHYYFSRSRALLANPLERGGYFASVAFLVAVLIGFTTWGLSAGFAVPLALWFGPALLASTFLAFVFDYLPHRPHRDRRRYRDTRVTLFPGLTPALLSQNLHLIHHLYPSIPYYRYAEAFRRLRPYLESRGARIDDLGEALPGTSTDKPSVSQ